MARFEIANHFEIARRGSVVTCHIVDGVARAGMQVETGHSGLPRLTISVIDYADNVSTGEFWIALQFRERPSLELLKELLPAGSTVKLTD